MEFLRLRAKNDTNGNPRRVFIAVQEGRIIAAEDEGHEGSAALARLPGYSGMKCSPADIETTPAEYRCVLRQYGPARRPARPPVQPAADAQPATDETLTALVNLTRWATGQNRAGNPYCKPEVCAALDVIARARGVSVESLCNSTL